MEKIWLRNYPPGMPAEVDVNAYRSVGQVLEQTAARFGARAAFVQMGTAISFSETEQLSRNFGAYLQASLKLPRGARVALMMPNILQYPVALFGALRSGYAVVNCNPLYTQRELEYQLKDSGAEVILFAENFSHVVADVIGSTQVRHVLTTQVADLLGFPEITAESTAPTSAIKNAVHFKSALQQGASQRPEPVDVAPEDTAFLQYTGGTTGVAKGAILSHGNIVANMQQIHRWLGLTLEDGRETVITALPLYHIFALTANCLTFFKMGMTNILITNPRDIPGLVKELARHPFSFITGVNTLFNALLQQPDFAKLDFSQLRLCIGGGMAVQKVVAERWKQVTGRTLIEGYGLTETSPAVAINATNLVDYNGAIGPPLPSTEIAIRDDAGKDLPIGEVGELCVRGPQVMKGYWNHPEETAKVAMPDGFLRTGDLATVDEAGLIHIVDRKKDMIIVSGFKVFPNEVEDVGARHPGVLEVGAVGVPDPNSGETVKVVVVKKDPDLTAEALIAYCRKYLTPYKVPHQVEFRKELPKTNIGKPLRRSLRESAAGGSVRAT